MASHLFFITLEPPPTNPCVIVNFSPVQFPCSSLSTLLDDSIPTNTLKCACQVHLKHDTHVCRWLSTVDMLVVCGVVLSQVIPSEVKDGTGDNMEKPGEFLYGGSSVCLHILQFVCPPEDLGFSFFFVIPVNFGLVYHLSRQAHIKHGCCIHLFFCF